MWGLTRAKSGPIHPLIRANPQMRQMVQVPIADEAMPPGEKQSIRPSVTCLDCFARAGGGRRSRAIRQRARAPPGATCSPGTYLMRRSAGVRDPALQDGISDDAAEPAGKPIHKKGAVR